MSWRRFKDLFNRVAPDETHFILGVDIGNNSSCIAQFDNVRRQPDLIDLSGGYGKPTVPTMLQYDSETKEWIIGEYAAISQSNRSVIITDCVKRLGTGMYYEIEGKMLSTANVLAIFLRELIGFCKNINPKAEIAAICAGIEVLVSEEAREELTKAFREAGFEKSVIFASDRECILKFFYNKLDEPDLPHKAVILDYGYTTITGGVYEISNIENQFGADKLNAECLSFLYEEEIAAKLLDERVFALLTRLYCQNQRKEPDALTQENKNAIRQFALQHKDLLFGQGISAKPVKLYYNFVYPPFAATITKQDVDNVINGFGEKLFVFLSDVLGKATPKLKPEEIRYVILTGGGFEMFWAREIVERMFPHSEIVSIPNAKSLIAQGAALLAADKLGLQGSLPVMVKDLPRVKTDIGVMAQDSGRERFIPILERNLFWWQSNSSKVFVFTDEVTNPVTIELFTRNEFGEVQPLRRLTLPNMPKRPRGVTKLKLSLEFISQRVLSVKINDLGFGEMFPPTDYSQKYTIEVTA